jgi:hypothetical protein
MITMTFQADAGAAAAVVEGEFVGAAVFLELLLHAESATVTTHSPAVASFIILLMCMCSPDEIQRAGGSRLVAQCIFGRPILQVSVDRPVGMMLSYRVIRFAMAAGSWPTLLIARLSI